ncbi:UDP-glucoronosyl and UDP-glucosyl transferase [Popillia japonica]|uniref:UDP-glucoronosyl and UDP-glucosyl transferase n=1 Tax=Popillia japonica TaxID=7064 RepID=A0AAW1ME95_POPJA
MKERFGEDIPPVADYENRVVGLLLTNYDPLLDFPEPVPPQIIPVGGVNARPPKELPQDLQEILDNSKDGVIFFSLGTNVDLSFSSRDTKNKFLNAFSKLKETVLWKYTGDDLVGASKNVIIRKWYPQNDILAHKNVKIFITHNGALSTHEAMYHGVPTVGIPLFMDQINNAKKMESKGLGKSIDFHKFTSEKLYRAIEEVLQNPKYKENMQKLSRQFKDRLETPLERAVFWIEYTLRHKDVKSISHRIWHEQLIGGLVEKGHNITLVSYAEPKLKSDNFTVIKIAGVMEVLADKLGDVINPEATVIGSIHNLWTKYIIPLAELDMKSDALKTILDYPKDKFDLIIFDVFNSQHLYPLVHYFGDPPVVVLRVSPFGLPPSVFDTMGSHSYSYYPMYTSTDTDQMGGY